MRVLVVGASGGVGSALAAAARARGAEVAGLSRSRDGFDLTDPDRAAAALAGVAGVFDVVLIATGALEIDGRRPEKRLADLDAGALAAQFALNAIGPALVLRALPRLLARDRRAVVAALSARVGSIGDNRAGGWYGYRAAKAALNQLLRTAAVELGRSHPQAIVAALHPGTVATPLTARYAGRHPTVPAPEAAANLWRVIDGLTPAQSGSFLDWAGHEVPW